MQFLSLQSALTIVGFPDSQSLGQSRAHISYHSPTIEHRAPITLKVQLRAAEKLAVYVTPPLSPTAHRTSVFDTPLGEKQRDQIGGMEGDDHQRRQYEQSGYPTGRVYSENPRGVATANVSERYRQAQPSSAQSPTPVSSVGVGGQSQGVGGYGYAQGQQYAPQLQSNPLPYQSEYPQESPRQQQQQQQQQQFPSYSSNLLYNMTQQPQQQSPYDPVPPYQPRQPAAIEVLSTQFGVPQYYNSGEPTSTPGPVALGSQYASTQFQQPISYQQPASLGRGTPSSSYPAGMADYSETGAPEVLEQQEVAQDSSGYDEAYNQYQNALRQTFENTHSGRLIEAGQSLLEISGWLLGHAVELGLVRDEQELHGERLKLWNDFNLCWLAVLQRQKDNTQEMLGTGQSPQPPQSILQEDFLERMGRELVRLCDNMERHGLVDYQMGVWEEEIISVLTDCLDLLGGGDDVEAPEAESGAQAGSSHPGAHVR
ncbi:hypothetical protein MMC06_002001 [Schaereria dolodes]|nr:hypothetical protein [Schaereria dolodes]